MQQEVTCETKGDSSATKSILLLTMVVLPVTAIAVGSTSTARTTLQQRY
jgi:hypothetical protein